MIMNYYNLSNYIIYLSNYTLYSIVHNPILLSLLISGSLLSRMQAMSISSKIARRIGAYAYSKILSKRMLHENKRNLSEAKSVGLGHRWNMVPGYHTVYLTTVKN
jgi:hypothetical protein